MGDFSLSKKATSPNFHRFTLPHSTLHIPFANWPFSLHHNSHFDATNFSHTFKLSHSTCVLPLASLPSPPPTAQRSSPPPSTLPPPLSMQSNEKVKNATTKLELLSTGGCSQFIVRDFSQHTYFSLLIHLNGKSKGGLGCQVPQVA